MLVLEDTRRFQVLSFDHESSVEARTEPGGRQAAYSDCRTLPEASSGTADVPSLASSQPALALPVLPLADVLLHKQRQTTRQAQSALMDALERHGYCLLRLPKQSLPGRIVESMLRVLRRRLFPDSDTSSSSSSSSWAASEPESESDDSEAPSARNRRSRHLQSSDIVYVSETGVPMWKLGYERSDDGVREFYRIHAGRPDDQPWPVPVGVSRPHWLRGLALCRDICDKALRLCLDSRRESDQCQDGQTASPCIRTRPGSGAWTWRSDRYASTPTDGIEERFGDYSVLYAMHYFNTVDIGEEPKNDPPSQPLTLSEQNGDADQSTASVRINVKQHVDPSLCVLEPYLSMECPGLQVWDEHYRRWIDTDGPDSPVAFLKKHVHPDDEFMCLFIGRAFARHVPSVKPTLHRVVAGPNNVSRRSIIYEQKYEEFFD